MIRIPVPCPYCQSEQVVKGGKTDTWKHRYRCQNPDCSHQPFLLDPAYRGRLPAIKQQEIEVSLNGSGVRDTARVLKISAARVIHELKKGPTLTAANQPFLNMLHPSAGDIIIHRVDDAVVDEMWSLGGDKPEQR
jgi:insertion element IS1 protein InsB